MIICKDFIDLYMGFLAEGFSCKQEDRYLAVQTPFQYLDGDMIELFIQELEDGTIIFTDLGETSRRMSLYNFNWNTSFARSNLNLILEKNNLSWDRGELYVKIRQPSHFGEKFHHIVRGAIQIETFLLTQKTRRPPSFRDRVQGFLVQNNIEPTLNYEVEGSSEKTWHVNFYVNHGKNLLINTLSNPSKTGSGYHVNNIFTAFSDIHDRHPEYRRTVIIDDEIHEWASPDIQLINKVVDFGPFYWTRKEELPIEFEKIGV